MRDERQSTETLSFRFWCERCRLTRGAAFTLAEVLITLAIIGIVAAMTIPTLVADYQKKQTVTQLKKVYADLQNVVKLSEIDNGPMEFWNYPQVATYLYEDVEPFIEKYYLPYFKSAKLYKKSEFNSDYSMNQRLVLSNYLLLSNGVILSFFSNIPNGYVWLFVDINGIKPPNEVGRDIFVFDAYRCTSNSDGNKIIFWGNYYNDTIEYLKNTTGYACNKDNTDMYKKFYCGRIIQLSGWTIPDDYPW